LGLSRTAFNYQKRVSNDECGLEQKVIETAKSANRVGYRQVGDLINNEREKEGLERVNHKRIYRVYTQNGLTLPIKKVKKGRLHTKDGACYRLKPLYKNHVWSWDFIEDKTVNGRKVRILNIIDEARHICLAAVPRRKWTAKEVVEVLSILMFKYGVPKHLRSDNGPEFISKAVRKWLKGIGVEIVYITPGSPWENGYCESFNARMRDEHLACEVFGNMYEIEVLTAQWVWRYNNVRPHSAFGGLPPMEAYRRGMVPDKPPMEITPVKQSISIA